LRTDDPLRFAASGAVVCVRGAVNKEEEEKKKNRLRKEGIRKVEAGEDAENHHHHGGLFPATTIAHAVSTRRRDTYFEENGNN